MAKNTEKETGLVDKAQRKLDLLQSDNSLTGDIVVSVELRNNLQRLLESYLLSSARTKATKRELESAKVNEDVAYAELQAAYKAVKRELKKHEQKTRKTKKKKKK